MAFLQIPLGLVSILLFIITSFFLFKCAHKYRLVMFAIDGIPLNYFGFDLNIFIHHNNLLLVEVHPQVSIGHGHCGQGVPINIRDPK